MTDKFIFRVIFHCGAEIVEIYVNQVFQSDLLGFLEVENFITEIDSNQQNTADKEKINEIFKGVKRSYIPLTSIVRIDEIEKTSTDNRYKKTVCDIRKFPVLPK